MRKLKRKKIVRAYLEEQLEKAQRRIQTISENAYQIRLQIEALDKIPVQKPLTKADIKAAADQAAAAGTSDIELPVVFPNAAGVTEEEIIKEALDATEETPNAVH